MFCNERLLVILLATIVGSSLVMQQSAGIFSTAYASESSPYDSGYDHGCDDAGRSESDKYINEPEKGPSFHTNEFMNGYYAGLSACSGGGSNGGGGFEESRPFDEQPSQSSQGGTDWMNLCQQAQSVGIIQTPCNQLVNPDNTLTEQGNRVLLCYGAGGLLYLLGGGMGQLLSLGKTASELGFCPK